MEVKTMFSGFVLAVKEGQDLQDLIHNTRVKNVNVWKEIVVNHHRGFREIHNVLVKFDFMDEEIQNLSNLTRECGIWFYWNAF